MGHNTTMYPPKKLHIPSHNLQVVCAVDDMDVCPILSCGIPIERMRKMRHPSDFLLTTLLSSKSILQKRRNIFTYCSFFLTI